MCVHVCVCVCVCVQNTFLERFALPGVSGLEEYSFYVENLRIELENQFQVGVCLFVCLTD